jgi:hypothetical protein
LPAVNVPVKVGFVISSTITAPVVGDTVMFPEGPAVTELTPAPAQADPVVVRSPPALVWTQRPEVRPVPSKVAPDTAPVAFTLPTFAAPALVKLPTVVLPAKVGEPDIVIFGVVPPLLARLPEAVTAVTPPLEAQENPVVISTPPAEASTQSPEVRSVAARLNAETGPVKVGSSRKLSTTAPVVGAAERFGLAEVTEATEPPPPPQAEPVAESLPAELAVTHPPGAKLLTCRVPVMM